MSEERKQILRMLAEGKITAEEAERLLDALGEDAGEVATADSSASESGGAPRFLHIQVSESGDKGENVNIKVPIMLLKAGLKLGGIVPSKLHTKITDHLGDMGVDVDLNGLDADKVDKFVRGLGKCSIDISGDKENVRIFCR